MRHASALIVGGGPAGAAAAITLARAGAAPLLIERTRETGDALCGGFLSWRTLRTLDRLGIAGEALTPRTITRVRLFAGERHAEARLPAPARAVSRHRLDTLLLAAAGAAGARIERGVHARAVEDGTVRLDDAPTTADAIFLATGKHDLRGAPRPIGADPSLGLRVRIAPSPALERLIGDAVELHLFDRGYAGIALQEDGSANVCLALRRSRLKEAGSPEALLADIAEGPLGERLAGWTGPIDAVANVPYGWRAAGDARVYRLGDQAGVIASLAGEGMGIALASGVSAARASLTGTSPERWQHGFTRALHRPIGVADLVRRVADRPAGAHVLLSLARSPGLVRGVGALTRVAREAA